MKCNILHESPNRLRVHLHCARMSLHEADLLEYYLRSVDGVTEVTVYDRTQDAVVRYTGQRSAVIGALASFSFAKAEVMELVPEHTSRALNREFEDKLAMTVMRRIFSKLFLPAPITTAMALYRSVKYIREGLTALWHGEPTGAGRHRRHRLYGSGRLLHRRLRHVHAAAGRNSGGVDPQEVCGRSGRGHVPECGQGMAAKRRYGGTGSHR